jgi:hypothetical protein
VLHDPPCDAPTVKIFVDPPELKPVASDIVKIICWPFGNGIWTGNEPLPSLKAEAGIDMFLCDANAWQEFDN